MPPRKSKAKTGPKAKEPAKEVAGEEESSNGVASMDEDAKEQIPTDPKPTSTEEPPSKKRKNAAPTDNPQKAPRRSGRGAPASRPSQEQLLHYMLSPAAQELCRPADETADLAHRGPIRTYSSSVLNPYEELLCAVILSRPISHRLGLRTIRTVLNEPYNFSSAGATRDAGSEKRHQALWDARTQHKDKTAEQIGSLAGVVMEKFTSGDDEEGSRMQRVREECEGDVARERGYMQKSVKGLGKTGLSIFFRRVQWLWDESYPFIDDRTVESLRKLGLPEDGEELRELIEMNWGELETKDLAGDDEPQRKRRALVTVLERAIGSDLEGKHEALLEAAVGS
ncbi:hypothetical protein LTR35_004387 [Friedmanniomyces endolithicus]|uniref:HhH-GPD domain-containing protein n=1 Tax=Friedmanniomyces endolithicus TaxID=329885 RepID=A0AAN6FYA2_9PEZI|nr:hypothetical protein LTR35_004387 [Friedmanniomyces endolithicus]KAK0295513.1 hypothetical protein LTS00_005713 [Friedmanniomyces endolithicus]KAK0326526.1 hypothetical protein LTR82_002368 [Friedmanniomyces endolithicus]KAK1017477.1 hypothetical protein LTR54_002135 [Friedmanniomyces endolithicus]